ncbi:hypothetical protein Tco_0322515, partial [Tanacetum coccineum]
MGPCISSYSQETGGPYHTDLPTPDDIRRFLQLDRVELNRTMKRGHRDHLSASLAHMLYCIVTEEQYNLAYFIVKRIECARATSTVNLPYGMFLTRLYRHIMEHYPYLDNVIYDVVDRVMHPLAVKQTRRPRSDRGKAHHSVSSTSAHHNHGSSSHQGDDDEDDGASRASTPSPTTYLNSLRPLDYQQYDVPTSSEQNDDLLFEHDTKIPSPKHQLSSPSAPNAPSKTPSTKDTSSSSIDYIPKSPTLSASPSPNGYLNSPTSPPLRIPPPPTTQENTSMDITLTLSLITPLDVQFNSPSHSPPIFGHPIPWNLLEAHKDSLVSRHSEVVNRSEVVKQSEVVKRREVVTPPDGAWTEYMSGGVTLLSISSTKHKERPLR